MLRAEGVEGKRRTRKKETRRNSEEEENENRVVSQCLVLKVSQGEGTDKLCEMLLMVK